MKRRLSFPLALLAVGALAGCQSKNLFFATESRWGLNVAGSSTAPSSVSLDYHRGEVAVIPKNNAGSTFSVYGGSDNDFSWGNGLALSQTFATGEAAVIATGGAKPDRTTLKQTGPVFFATGTTFGLNLRLLAAESAAPGLIAGYRRDEMVIIPTGEGATEASPVYADISIIQLPSATPAGAAQRFPGREPVIAGGVRIKQQFATGAAALKVAANPWAKAKLDQAAGVTAATTALVDRTKYAQKLATVTDPAAQGKILERARGAFVGDNVELAGNYVDFVNLTVPNLAPASLGKLQAAAADLVK
jgi:hypothetical protein